MGSTSNARTESGHRRGVIKRIAPLKLALGALALLMVSSVLAASGAGYALDPWAAPGGGALSSSGGAYSLGSTVGQTGAGKASGGGYTLYSGFWKPGGAKVVPNPVPIYIPVVLQSPPPPPTPTPPPPTTTCPEKESNNDPEHSQPLPTNNGSCIGTFENERSGDTFDYFSIQANQGQHIVVKLTGIPAGANYDIALQRKDGPNVYTTVDASAKLGQADELIEYVADSNNRYYIRVKLTTKSPNAANKYILSVAIN